MLGLTDETETYFGFISGLVGLQPSPWNYVFKKATQTHLGDRGVKERIRTLNHLLHSRIRRQECAQNSLSPVVSFSLPHFLSLSTVSPSLKQNCHSSNLEGKRPRTGRKTHEMMGNDLTEVENIDACSQTCNKPISPFRPPPPLRQKSFGKVSLSSSWLGFQVPRWKKHFPSISPSHFQSHYHLTSPWQHGLSQELQKPKKNH